MNINLFRDIRPVIDFIYALIDEVENKDAELAEVRKVARDYSDSYNQALLEINDLKKQNHAMQVFIEDHVPEEKKKLIFTD
jgi:hypothetical protein